ncbi:MAG: thioredoxin domain-containing protein [Propionibacteriaceae bacterium]|jgi:protein-disulfide isomerase|nr:thioredoxin domain-containing protein [Propionibacteriaceae bacterium]
MASSSQVRRSRREALEAQRLQAAAKTRRNRILFVAAGILVLALVIGVAAWGIISANRSGGSDIPPNANAAQNGILLAPAVEGAPTLEIFSDFNCTSCKAADLTLDAALQQIADEGKVNVVIHPVEMIIPNSREMAIAATCADFGGKFHEFYHQAYIAQNGESGFSDEQIMTTIPTAAGLAGEALTAYQTCYTTKATGSFVDKSTKNFLTLKRGTPTILLDGVVVNEKIWNSSTGTYDPDKLRALLAGL